MLSIVILNVVMLSVIMLSVVAPYLTLALASTFKSGCHLCY
jgi:hypothetical protein